MSASDQLRTLPSVDEVLQQFRQRQVPHELLKKAIREAIDEARNALRRGDPLPDIPQTVDAALARLQTPSLRRVINATGIILHTNLGRAPLNRAADLGNYSNLEFDLTTGKRGKRDVHIGPLLKELTGKPGIAVNNNAAAVYLVLNELAAGGEVIVSRGELIEIGDGFRIPDIMQRAGVTLREVGTTNRTRLDDYRNAINERTRLLLRVHPSNFRIEGFTASVVLQDLTALGRDKGIPVYEDLGSGCMADLSAYGITEPLVRDSIAAGVNLVSFSGDKLLGGPQAGMICGDAELVARIRHNPMFRALRLDKLVLHSLEWTLRTLLLERWDDVAAMRMIRLPLDQIRSRAENILRSIPELPATVVEGESKIGGGSTPEQTLRTALIAIDSPHVSRWERRLRQTDPPVIARITDNRLLLDLRTVAPDEDTLLIARLSENLKGDESIPLS